MANDILIEVDDRGRLSLGRLGVERGSRWLGHRAPDGTVILAPAQVTTTHEAAFRSDPERAQLLDGPWELTDITEELDRLGDANER